MATLAPAELRAARRAAEAEIERLISLLDELDGDPDIEEDDPLEDDDADEDAEPGEEDDPLESNFGVACFAGDDELEADPAESGVADQDALEEVYGRVS
ncbi:hypothetical protein CCR97_10165 [Rhodoplanes elegans]|uniref:Uncharacterized protein n=2 Tax=Rhodoplanes elegans TaxID=29408 RepID=A0A327KQI8_9BRAD|nr:hypothetical protein [Rhodoplanes elegans]RAI40547.1 hypothetical protein CH338_05995 [Rhodoplanes elegans]